MAEPSLIFLSYGSNDQKAAREVRTMLMESGFRVWMAPDDIRGTRPWAEQILDAIAESAMMVVLVSSDANQSKHVGTEVSLAFEQGKAVLPVRVEDVTMSGILRFHLAIIQFIDAFPPPLSAHKAKLIREVADRIGATTPLPPEPPESTGRRMAAWFAGSRWRLIGVVAAAMVVLTAVAILARGGLTPATPVAEGTTTTADATTTTAETTTTGAPTTTSGATTTTPSEEFDRFEDDTGRLVVDAPPNWSANGQEANIGGEAIGPGLTVSPDTSAFHDGWETPGAFIFASRILYEQYGTAEAYLNSLSRYQPCDATERRPYQDPKYVGVADYSTGCGPEGVGAFKLAAVPIESPDYLIAVFYKGPPEDDSALRGAILDSFNYSGAFDWAPAG